MVFMEIIENFVLLQLSHVGKNAMNKLRETIEEDAELSKQHACELHVQNAALRVFEQRRALV
jgi:hypothetical protein